MAYNLQTLITILQQILDPQRKCRIHDDSKPQLNSLLDKAVSLQLILEQHSLPKLEDLEREIRDAAQKAEDVIESRNLIRQSIKWFISCISLKQEKKKKICSLEREIRDAAHKAEDIIESEMVDRMRFRILTRELLIRFSSADLQQVTQELDSVLEQVGKLVEVEAGNKIISRGISSLTAAPSSNPKSARASTVVGFDEDLIKLKERLVGMPSKLEIIPIVGMGGAGKTTLARNLYEDPLIVSHFEARAWTSVSQDYNMRSILLSLLSCINGKEAVDGDVSKLKDSLYKSLYGRRYLIVLDDIWSTQVWDEITRYFPNNENGSRVVITTRESNVATYANSHCKQHAMQLLSESASWNLFCQIVFGENDCPCVLESIGRKIAGDCGGLPLAITVIGGLLSEVRRSKDVWEDIGENVRGAIARSGEDEQYSSILSLSYNHLPNYLKPCFLYMGGFPEDYEIKGSALICYWIAEGFIKSNTQEKSLEEVAEEYLKGLVERNLLMVRRNKSNRKVIRYVIHDVLRDLCIRKAREDNFLHVKTDDRGRGMISKLRRVSIEQRYSYERYSYGMEDTHAELMSLARSFLCIDRSWSNPSPVVSYISSMSNLLRVLDVMDSQDFKKFPKEILQLVNLRYLGLSCERLCVGISRLVNLQILINRCVISSYVPSEIWKMSRLRYLKFSASWFRSEDDDIEMLVEMNKLHTIKCLKLTESLLERGFLQAIPNIKNLGIALSSGQVIDFSHLHTLETLKCKWFYGKDCGFPPTLKNLNLYHCSVFPRMATTLCGLPNLEVLKIRSCDFFLDTEVVAKEWEVREGEEFKSLQFLQLDDLKLVRWKADETNFPKLRHLLLQKCEQLKEIPSGIGEIPSLELIEMKRCSASSMVSAKQIVEAQHSEYDNYALQLSIT